MDNDAITAYILTLLAEKGKIPVSDIGEYNYLESGHIDSLGLIKFLARIEERFGIEIGEDDLGDKRIRTVSGLAVLIRNKLAHDDE